MSYVYKRLLRYFCTRRYSTVQVVRTIICYEYTRAEDSSIPVVQTWLTVKGSEVATSFDAVNLLLRVGT